jgi:hypothetical protein
MKLPFEMKNVFVVFRATLSEAGMMGRVEASTRISFF